MGHDRICLVGALSHYTCPLVPVVVFSIYAFEWLWSSPLHHCRMCLCSGCFEPTNSTRCSCVTSIDKLTEAMRAPLKQAWHLAARTVGLPGTSRAACAFLSAVLMRGHLAYTEISSDVNNIVTQNGPAVLVDSSLALMTLLLQVRNSKIPGASQATCTYITRWVFSRWTPGKFSIITNSRMVLQLIHTCR